MEHRLICLLGMSAVAKDSIARILQYYHKFNFIVSHTTRPKRSSEQNGVEYYFTGQSTMDLMIYNDEMVEYRVYETIQNGEKTKWKYGISKEEIDNKLKLNHCVTCVDLQGYNDLKNYIGEDNIIPIYIESDYADRLIRAIARDKNFEKEEFDRRYKDDLIKFKDVILHNNENIYNVYNDNLRECYNEIENILIDERVINSI